MSLKVNQDGSILGWPNNSTSNCALVGYNAADQGFYVLSVDASGVLNNTSGVLFATASVPQSTTAQSIIAGVASKQILVIGLILSCGGTSTVITFNTSSGDAISSAITLPVNTPVNFNQSFGLFTTVAGEGLTATTGAGATIGVTVAYKLI